MKKLMVSILGVLFFMCTDNQENILSYGCFLDENGGVEFRLFAPNAIEVEVEIFKNCDDETGEIFGMKSDDTGNWTVKIEKLSGQFYGYHITDSDGKSALLFDPYSKALVRKNVYFEPSKSVIVDENFDWGDDELISVTPDELIIYEMHVRDLTAHKSAKSKFAGKYLGLTEGIALEHLKSLGVTAVELLPTQEFNNIEIKFGEEMMGIVNTWNPYEQNHWGYMTSAFFAPESYYATDGNLNWAKFSGGNGNAVREFKQMVKTLHENGIAVLMDVVYNHTSQYDNNSLKRLNKNGYYRIDKNGNYIAESWCGNDVNTADSTTQKLILESVKFWMTKYHIDGFRFDLAKLFDWETVEKIIAETQKINPNVIIIAEPWGGGYDPNGFADRGWAAWNDQFRNGIKGQNPHDGLGFIFGKWQGGNNKKSLKRYIRGSLRDEGGQFHKIEQSVNYLESHDDHTLGDFIRLGLHENSENEMIENLDLHAKLSDNALILNQLAAMILFTSRGITMIHEGQEFGRSKIIAETHCPDENIGKIDHNSYNKDNETNYINYEHLEANRELVDFYAELIHLRKLNSSFGNAQKIEFVESDLEFSIGYILDGKFLVLLNTDTENECEFSIDGDWHSILTTKNTKFEQENGFVKLNKQSGVLFKKI